jgi:hypothetical protein
MIHKRQSFRHPRIHGGIAMARAWQGDHKYMIPQHLHYDAPSD